MLSIWLYIQIFVRNTRPANQSIVLETPKSSCCLKYTCEMSQLYQIQMVVLLKVDAKFHIFLNARQSPESPPRETSEERADLTIFAAWVEEKYG